ncbi:hypothetical protein [Streptomyces sp. NPDC056227]|uniref:hypothetical protein n=1 Tax=Streptomyces sp. NPDC056227 TaxID=3345753 RepID=UPI0035DDE78B
MLDAHVPERTALLAEQLRSPDPATRYDAIRMTQALITAWRGDHTDLVMLLADCLLPEDPYTAAAGTCSGMVGALGAARLNGTMQRRSQHEHWRRDGRRQAYAAFVEAAVDYGEAIGTVQASRRDEAGHEQSAGSRAGGGARRCGPCGSRGRAGNERLGMRDWRVSPWAPLGSLSFRAERAP